MNLALLMRYYEIIAEVEISRKVVLKRFKFSW